MSMAGLDFNNCVVALGTCNSPMLQELDFSYVAGLNDVALYKILSAPKDSRPGTHTIIKLQAKTLVWLNLSIKAHDTQEIFAHNIAIWQ